jgi:hypothetical protein
LADARRGTGHEGNLEIFHWGLSVSMWVWKTRCQAVHAIHFA